MKILFIKRYFFCINFCIIKWLLKIYLEAQFKEFRNFWISIWTLWWITYWKKHRINLNQQNSKATCNSGQIVWKRIYVFLHMNLKYPCLCVSVVCNGVKETIITLSKWNHLPLSENLEIKHPRADSKQQFINPYWVLSHS